MQSALSGSLAIACLLLPTAAPAAVGQRVFRAEDFGLKSDGATDDGPAIRRLLDAAVNAGGPARVAFPAERTIRVETAPGRYVFRFDEVADLTVDGSGSTFVLGPNVRFLRLTHSSRMTIRMSCRMQSPVTLDSCEVTALLWFHAERVEGPFPSNVALRDCTLRRGRGNPRLAVSFAGRAPGHAGPSAIHDVLVERCRIWGDFSAVGVDGLRLVGNAFQEQGAATRAEHSSAQVGR